MATKIRYSWWWCWLLVMQHLTLKMYFRQMASTRVLHYTWHCVGGQKSRLSIIITLMDVGCISDKTWVGINNSQNNLIQEDVRVWNLYQAVLVTWVCSQVYPNEKAKSMLCETLSGSVTSKVMNQSCVDKILGGNLPPEIARRDIFKTQ